MTSISAKRSGFEIQCTASASIVGVISVHHIIVVSEDGNYRANLNPNGTLTGFAKRASSNYTYAWKSVSEKSKYVRELIARVENDPDIKKAYDDVRKAAISKAAALQKEEIEIRIEQLQGFLNTLKDQLRQHGIEGETQ